MKNINPKTDKKLVKCAISLIDAVNDDNNIKGDMMKTARWSARHKLHMNFDRNTNEIIDSIRWHYDDFKRIYRRNVFNKETRGELRHKCYIVEKRITELKCRRLQRHPGEDNEDYYDVFYDMLNEMKDMLKAKNINLR